MRIRVLVACLFAFAPVAEGEDPAAGIRLPLVPDAAPDDGKESAPRLVITLTKDGRLFAQGKQLTLNRLGAGLRGAKSSYKLRQAKRGQDGEFDPGTGVKVPALFVLLRADAEVPWRHVEWVQTILAEQKYVRFQFATTRANADDPGKVPVPLPAPVSLTAIPKTPPTEISIEVQVVADKERPTKWGPADKQTKVELATAVLYRLDDEETRDSEAVKKRLAEVCRSAKDYRPKPDAIICVIRATAKVPCKHVVELAAFFRNQGMEHIHLCSADSTALPPGSVRDAYNLPYPKGNELPASVGGSAGITNCGDPEKKIVEDD